MALHVPQARRVGQLGPMIVVSFVRCTWGSNGSRVGRLLSTINFRRILTLLSYVTKL